MINLKDKKVLITGATGGIGNCLVEKFYNLGANVVATGTNEEKLSSIKNKFEYFFFEKQVSTLQEEYFLPLIFLNH